FVNISHTEKVAAVVLAKSAVGIDVELKTRSAERVMSRVATDREKKWTTQLIPVSKTEKLSAPILLWSSKEAFSKALGLGMRFGFKAFEIDLLNGPPYLGKTELTGPL